MGADDNHEEARRVLARAGMLRRAADLDLLLFFGRHPHTLLSSDQIATFLGYEITQIAESLELLLDAGILTRTQNPTHAARLYVLTPGDESGGWLPGLLQFAATRQGRLALLTELSERRTRPDAKHQGRITRNLRAVRG